MRMPKVPEQQKVKKKSPIIKKTSVSMKEDGVKDLVGCLLSCLRNIHVFHLNSESYAEHEALGELYDCLYELTDCLAEQYIGMCGPVEQGVNKQFKTAIDLVEYLKNESCSCTAEDSGLSATIDEVVILLNKTCYKLRRLK